MFFANVLVLLLIVIGLEKIQANPDENYWPDISCHTTEVMEELTDNIMEENLLCRKRTTPSAWMKDLDFSLGNCPKICLLEELELIEYNAANKSAPLSFRDDDGSMLLMELHGDYKAGLKFVKKVKDECGKILHRILYVEKHPCNSDKVNEIMDCVQNALRC